MNTPHLVVVSGPDAGRKFGLSPGNEILIGRHRDCGVVLFDSSVSRRHARLEVLPQGVMLEDLGSRFGTHCNGQKVSKRKLVSGDRLQLGRVLLEFRTQAMTGRHTPAPGDIRAGSPTGRAQGPTMRVPSHAKKEQYQVLQSICLNKNDLEREKTASSVDFDLKHNMSMGNFSMVSLTSDGDLKIANRKRHRETAEIRTMEDAHLKLSILYEAGKQFAQCRDVDTLFIQVVDLLIKVVNAKNVLIFLVDKETNVLAPKFARGPDGEFADFSQVVYSRTLLETCLRSREALLTSDAQDDERFQAGMSIIQFNFKSVMVIPLWTGDQILGVMQVDNNQAVGTFSEHDLGFATALANQAAISIQNLILIDDIKNEAQIRSNLQRYLSPSIVDKIIEEKGELALGGEKKKCNVLFSDIRGFTSLSESLDPQTVVALLNEYFTAMTEIIFNFEGTLDKYIGDAIMAVFGSPYSREDDHMRAVKAAVNMQIKLQELNKKWLSEGRATFEMGIGVGTGEVIAGNIGSLQRMEYTVIGDTVNTASRLCSVAGPRQVVLHPETARLVNSELTLRSLGPVALKGKSEKLEIFEVVYP